MAQENETNISEYIDKETGKPIIYAQNVPEILRGLTVENCGFALNDPHFEELDAMSNFDRASLGAEEWNRWVQWVQLRYRRWLRNRVLPRKVEVSVAASNIFDFIGVGTGTADGIETETDETTSRNVCCFKGFTFPGRVSFDRHQFFEKANFNNAIFCDSASFTNVIFKKGAAFIETKFYGSADFYSARFEGKAHFDSAQILGVLDIDEVSFLDGATMRLVAVHGDMCSSQVTCNGPMTLWGAKIYGVANFVKAKLWQGIEATDAAFHQLVLFDDAQTNGSIKFNGTDFRQGISAERAFFYDNFECKRAEFGNSVNMSWAVFGGYANFSGSVFRRSLNIRFTQFPYRSSFINCHFYGHVDLDHANFGGGTNVGPNNHDAAAAVETTQGCLSSNKDPALTIPNFLGARFEVAPNLSFAEVHVPSLPNLDTVYKRTLRWFGCGVEHQWISDRKAASKLRVLIGLASEGSNSREEKRFFRSELLCRRGHEAKSRREITMINLFDVISMCGLSFWRPIGWLALFWSPLFLLVYACAADFSLLDLILGQLSCRDYGELLSFTAANSVPFIGLFKGSDSGAITHLFVSADNIPYWASVAHNLIATVHIFFALLAIRNYFKLG